MASYAAAVEEVMQRMRKSVDEQKRKRSALTPLWAPTSWFYAYIQLMTLF